MDADEKFKYLCSNVSIEVTPLKGHPKEWGLCNAYWCRLEYNGKVIEKTFIIGQEPDAVKAMRILFTNSANHKYLFDSEDLENVSIKRIKEIKKNTKKLKKLLGDDYKLYLDTWRETQE